MRRDLAALAGRPHDLLVVGGGIYGATAAWDAAQRGLSVALVEKHDFGSGTSWNSLKTIHGGLRHLQRGEIGLLRESVRERRVLLGIAPELVRPLPFLVPTRGHGWRELLAAGLLASDLLSWDRSRGLPEPQRVPAARMLSPRELGQRAPELAGPGTSGAAAWTDAQVSSSERLLLAFLHAACGAGAALANHAEAEALLRCGARVVGARVRDRETGQALEVRASLVLNASGPWADDVLELAGIARPRVPLLRAMNLVLRRAVVRDHAVGARAEGRFLFLVPWRDRAIVGTAYQPSERTEDPGWALAFREQASRAFPWAGIGPEDVALVHLGRVPGSAGGLWSHSLVVDHEREDGVPGLVSAFGAKYTAARAVAETAVDLVCARLGRPVPPCRTATTPLAQARPLEGPLAERARAAVAGEMALHLEDALLRRLDLGTEGPPAEADVEAVLGAMAGELGWDEARRAAEREALAGSLARHWPAGARAGAG